MNWIEVTAYNGSKLLLNIDHIVSVSTFFDKERNLNYTGIFTVIDGMKTSKDGEGEEQFYQSSDSYESIRDKILNLPQYKPTWIKLSEDKNND